MHATQICLQRTVFLICAAICFVDLPVQLATEQDLQLPSEIRLTKQQVFCLRTQANKQAKGLGPRGREKPLRLFIRPRGCTIAHLRERSHLKMRQVCALGWALPPWLVRLHPQASGSCRPAGIDIYWAVHARDPVSIAAWVVILQLLYRLTRSTGSQTCVQTSFELARQTKPDLFRGYGLCYSCRSGASPSAS